LGTPLDLLLGLRFYLEVLVFVRQGGREMLRPTPYYFRSVLFATFLMVIASPIVSICYEHDFGVLGGRIDCAAGMGIRLVEKLRSNVSIGHIWVVWTPAAAGQWRTFRQGFERTVE
jgi:hypothetical protein